MKSITLRQATRTEPMMMIIKYNRNAETLMNEMKVNNAEAIGLVIIFNSKTRLYCRRKTLKGNAPPVHGS
jgi:hypothetical protein